MKHIDLLKRMAFGLSLICSTGLWTSCEDTVLNLEPVDTFSELTAFSSPERCELSVIGAYDAAQCGLYSNGSRTRGYPFGAASIILSEMRGEDMDLTATFYGPVHTNTFNGSTGNVVSMWETSFEAINRYNVVIQGINGAIESGVLTQEQGEQYLGECYFLRALTYHNLMIHYAYPYNLEGNNDYGLPIYLTPVTDPSQMEAQLKIGRSSVKDTYAQILEDLKNAENMLPDAIGDSPIARASRGAAIALKTRVYLHMRDWNNVITEAAKLKTGPYKLEADPATPFTAFTQNTESIFSIANSAADNGSINGAMSAMFSILEGGRGMCPTSPILYNSSYWRADDKRRGLLLYRESDTYYWCNKYQHPGVYDEWAPIIRYAEVILNEAEAQARLGENNKEAAVNLLNEVRNRSLADTTTQAYQKEDFADTKALVEAILWERRIEFHGEGRRWEDIHRLTVDDLCPTGGVPAKVSYTSVMEKNISVPNGPIDQSYFTINAVPYTDHRFLWPIPQNDIIRNPTLAGQQNVGW